jgi:hypothetical protein
LCPNWKKLGQAYVKETEPQHPEQVRQRLEKPLHRRARELGYELKKVEPAAVGGQAQGLLPQ